MSDPILAHKSPQTAAGFAIGLNPAPRGQEPGHGGTNGGEDGKGVGLVVHIGDSRDILPTLPDESVHCVVTSPPYWGLRDYGTGTWEGGDSACEHWVGGQVQDGKAPGAITTGQRRGVDAGRCRDCGAVRHDRQLGLEKALDCLGWATGNQMMKLREDLTDEEVAFVYRELKKAGAL